MARRLAAALILGLSIMALSGAGWDRAQAQASAPWPTRPVRFILPFGPGSGIDVGARIVGERLAARWGQPVVIENRAGGDGILAITTFINANDDHILLFAGVGSYTVHPYMMEKTPYDFKRDVQPVARIANTLMAVTLSSKDKAPDLKSFVAYARANPGKLNAAVPQGITELFFDGFLKAEGLDIPKVPYKDTVQAVPDLAEGRLDIIYSSYSVVRPTAEGGGVRVVAMGSRDRVPSLANIPTVLEAGVPSLQLECLSGVFGPTKMPLELRKRIGQDVVEAMKDQSVLDRFVASGQAPMPGGAAELEVSLQAQIDQVEAVAKLIGLKKR
jgi:hypothetical protein